MAPFPRIVAARHSISALPESVSRYTTSPAGQWALRPGRRTTYLVTPPWPCECAKPDLHSSPIQIVARVDRMNSCSRSKTNQNLDQPRKRRVMA